MAKRKGKKVGQSQLSGSFKRNKMASQNVKEVQRKIEGDLSFSEFQELEKVTLTEREFIV
jgi:hypothetical protein